jgi:hypothetical protein
MRNESMHLRSLVPVQRHLRPQSCSTEQGHGKVHGISRSQRPAWTQDRNSNNLFGFYWDASTPSYLPVNGDPAVQDAALDVLNSRFNGHIIEERAAAFVHLFEQHHPTD